MNDRWQVAVALADFSIAYPAMNISSENSHGSGSFSIAYPAMNATSGDRVGCRFFSIAYPAMNSMP